MTEKTEFLEIGILGKTKGLKGEIFFYPYNEETLNPLKGSIAQLNNSEKKSLTIISHKVKTPGKRILQFEDHGRIEDVESYVNLKLSALKTDMPDLEDGEYYLDDLLGFSVFDSSKNLIGQVKGFYFNNAHDVLVLDNGKKFGLDVLQLN